MTARHELQVEMKKKEHDLEQKIQDLCQDKGALETENQKITLEKENLEISTSLLNDEVMVSLGYVRKAGTVFENSVTVLKICCAKLFKNSILL